MKKLVSILLIAVMLMAVMSVSVFAEDYNFTDNKVMLSLRHSDYEVTLDNLSQYGVVSIEKVGMYYYALILDKHDCQNVLDVIDALRHAENSYKYMVEPEYIYDIVDPFEDQLYHERFLEKYGYLTFYHEEYYHHVDESDDNSDIDWVLVYGVTDIMEEPTENPITRYRIIEDLVYGTTYYYAPFETPYCVYDVAKDEFLDITKVDFDDYKGLREAFCTGEHGVLIGDVDVDGVITIMDATEIQRSLAKLITLVVNYRVADFDRSKSVDIMDATAVQKHIAGLDNKPTYNEDMVYAEFNNMYDVDTGIEEIPFEALFSDAKVSKISSERFGVIIKSKEQYDSVYYPELEEGFISDEFFEDKWIVISGCRVTDAEMVADITYLGVRGNTLFMRADRVLNDTNGVMEPIAPIYHSIVAVDKDALAQVTEIIWL